MNHLIMRSLTLKFLLLLICVTHGNAHGLDSIELQRSLNSLLDDHLTARRTTVALKVVDLTTGQVLFDRFGDRLFTPASNLKIYTSACALDTFAPEHCFPTTIAATVDKETKSIIGNLVLKGGGNSMLSMDDLKVLANRVTKEWGVKTLRGKVVVNNSRYHNIELGPGWMWDDQPYYFNMHVTPTMVDFNVREIDGVGSKQGETVRVAVADPALWTASSFSRRLREAGVTIEPQQKVTAAGIQRELNFAGTNLADTLKHFNHESENAVGEVLLHEIAIAKGKVQPRWTDGAELITAWLHDTAGLGKGSFRLVDGSGLSRYNLISADSSVKLLAFMRQHRHYQTFFDSLPAYEVETSNGSNQELVRAKSGGMSGVSTISGYVQTVEGRQLAFSLLGNGFIGTNEPVRDLRSKVWENLVQYRSLDEKTASRRGAEIAE